jgi:hypothetical protein
MRQSHTRQSHLRQSLGRIALAAKLFVLRFIIPLCLASVYLAQSAEAVVTGQSPATGKCAENSCSSDTPIGGVSPPGSAGNPNDWAMCGILSLEGEDFALLQTARIEVAGDQYVQRVKWTGSNPHAPVRFTWTCAFFTEFTGTGWPAPSQARISYPAPVTAPGGGPPASKAIAGLTDACTWTGVEGSLSTNSAVYTQIESTGNTLAGVQPAKQGLSTYAFCYTYVGKSPSVKYTFAPGSSISWGDGSTSAITGQFTYNSSNGDLSAVDVKLAGSNPEDGTYNTAFASPIGPPTKKIDVSNSKGYVVLVFKGDLAGVDDSLNPAAGASEYCLFCGSGGAVVSTTATGGVQVSSAPPPGWVYDYVGAPKLYQHTTSTNLPVSTSNYWCFMTGVSGGETAFDAGLTMGSPSYAYKTTNNSGLYWNCLKFVQ